MFGDVITFDIDASSITIDFPSIGFLNFDQSSFNGFIFGNLDWVGMTGLVTGVNLTTNITGLDIGDVAFGADFVSVDFGINSGTAGNFFSGAYVTLDLDTTHIPEPSIIALFYGRLSWVVSRHQTNFIEYPLLADNGQMAIQIEGLLCAGS